LTDKTAAPNGAAVLSVYFVHMCQPFAHVYKQKVDILANGKALRGGGARPEMPEKGENQREKRTGTEIASS